MSLFDKVRAEHERLLDRVGCGKPLNASAIKELADQVVSQLEGTLYIEERRELRHMFLFWRSYLSSLRDVEDTWPEADLIALDDIVPAESLRSHVEEEHAAAAARGADSDAGHADEPRTSEARRSMEFWELELLRILAGERDADVERAGGACAHIQGLIRSTADAVLSRVYFLRALEHVAWTWNPDPGRTRDKASVFLDLLTEYPSGAAFSRFVDLFDPPDPCWFQGVIGCTELRWKALRALDACFRKASPQPVKAQVSSDDDAVSFSTENRDKYARILRAHLVLPEFASYAGRALTNVRALPLDRSHLIDLLFAHPNALRGVLEAVTAFVDATEARHVLRRLYRACLSLSADSEDTFCSQLSSLGCTVKRREAGLRITTPESMHGRRLDIEIVDPAEYDDPASDEIYAAYYAIYCENVGVQMDTAIAELTV